MEIWEERFYNEERNKTESYKTFSMFQQFLKMEKPRNLKELTKQLYPNATTDKQLNTKYNSIKRNAMLYKWYERARQYDVHIIQEVDEALIQKFNDFRLAEFDNATQRVTGHNVTYNNIKKNDTEVVVTKNGLKERPKRDSDITKSEKENQEAYSLALDDVIKLLTGGVIRTENKNTDSVKVSADVKAKLDNKTIFDLVDNELGLKK